MKLVSEQIKEVCDDLLKIYKEKAGFDTQGLFNMGMFVAFEHISEVCELHKRESESQVKVAFEYGAASIIEGEGLTTSQYVERAYSND